MLTKNGLIAAAIGALSMLMSEPTAKSYVKRTCMFVLSIATFTFTFTQGCDILGHHFHFEAFSVVHTNLICMFCFDPLSKVFSNRCDFGL